MKIFNHESRMIYLKSILMFILFNLINCDDLKCYKSEPFQDGRNTIYEFTNLIDKVIISDDHLIVAGLNDVYLIDQYDDRCLSRNQFYDKTTNLEPQNKNKILVELDKDLEKFLICNTMIKNGCSIFYHEHGHLRLTNDNFNFNSNFNLKSCLISKLFNEPNNFWITCEPDKKNRIVLAKLKFDEIENVFQLVGSKDRKSSIYLYDYDKDVKTEIIYEFDHLMIDSKERFYHGYVLKREIINGQLSTKLGRVCLSDNTFRSYSEITLNCKEKQNLFNWPTGDIYTYASSGQLGYAYSYLNKDTLYITWNYYNDKRKSIDESKGSVLCAFDIEKIDKFFGESIKKCNSGDSVNKIKVMTQYQANKKTAKGLCFNETEKLDPNQLSCLKNPKNPYIEYVEKSLNGEFLYKFDDEIIISSSAFLFRNQNSEMERGVVLSTNKGKIIRVIRDQNNTMKIGHELQLNMKSIKQIDSFVSKDSIYFITGYALIRYPFDLSNRTSEIDERKKKIPESEKLKKKKDHRKWIPIVIILTIISTIVFIWLLYAFWKHLKSQKKKPKYSIDDLEEKISLKPRSNFTRQASEMLSKNNILINGACLKTYEKIGSGYFACVFRGELKILGPKIEKDKSTIEVAIKTLNVNLGTEDDEVRKASKSLIDEALLMKDLKHENILGIIGVCIEENSLPKIILPYMKQGSLLEYIRSDKNELTVRELLNFAIDVAEGMVYLSSLKYVHRDLAARNCMMDENFRIKICDFGLAKDCYEQSFYVSKSKSSLPIKWLAPECLERSSFSHESDIWSFGILLWELMTRGNIPYPTIESYRVLDYIKQNYRLQRPEACPIQVYEIMLDCWQILAFMRPSFNEIVLRIQAIVNKKEDEFDIYPNICVNYVNYPIEEYYSKKNQQTNETSYTIEQSIYDRPIKNLNTKIEMPGKILESEL